MHAARIAQQQAAWNAAKAARPQAATGTGAGAPAPAYDPGITRLVARMRDRLPGAVADLSRHGRKTGHWMWWACPTDRAGVNEPGPGPGTRVGTHAAALDLCRRAPEAWRVVLEVLCDLLETRGKDAVLPSKHDQGRAEFFVRCWQSTFLTHTLPQFMGAWAPHFAAQLSDLFHCGRRLYVWWGGYVAACKVSRASRSGSRAWWRG